MLLFKYHKEDYPDLVKEIAKELKHTIENVVEGVDDIYFGNDLKKEKRVEK